MPVGGSLVWPIPQTPHMGIDLIMHYAVISGKVGWIWPAGLKVCQCRQGKSQKICANKICLYDEFPQKRQNLKSRLTMRKTCFIVSWAEKLLQSKTKNPQTNKICGNQLEEPLFLLFSLQYCHQLRKNSHNVRKSVICICKSIISLNFGCSLLYRIYLENRLIGK